MTATFFANQDEFRTWLASNHKTETELIVGYYKVHTQKPSMTWSQSVDQALCFGWIDGIRRKIDNESYCIRFTPRRRDSIWSDINIKKIEVLTKAGLMTEDGIIAYKFKSENNSKIFELDTKYVSQFQSNQPAWEFYEQQPPSYKKMVTYWIMSAKQEKTRFSRLSRAIQDSENQKRVKW